MSDRTGERNAPAGRVVFPIRLRCASVDDLLEHPGLEDAIARALGRSLERAQLQLPAPAAPPSIGEPYLARGELTGSEQARLLERVRRAVDQALARTAPPVPARRAVDRPAARPWRILRSLDFRAPTGLFLDWVESANGAPLPDRVLYQDEEATERWVEVWWVQTGRTAAVGDLGEELRRRAEQLARLGPRQVLAWGITPFDAGRQQLAGLDASGRAGRLPDLRRRNARRIDGNGPEAVLLHGGQAVFAFMRLPRIGIADLLTPGLPVRIELRLREAEFLIDPERFEAAVGIGWQRFAEEYGDDRLRVELLPATLRRAAAPAAVGRLLAGAIGQEQAGPGRPAESLYVLTGAILARMPAAVRAQAETWTDDTTRRLDESATLDRLQPGWRVLYARTRLDAGPERVAAARQRPEARRVAAVLRERLGAEPDLRWAADLATLLDRTFGTDPAPDRPTGGTPFEYVLAELAATGDLVRLFDAADTSGHFGLRQRLLLLSLPTGFATHPRVQRLRADLTAARQAATWNLYRTDAVPPELWLDRDQSRRVRVGEVLGDVDSIYIFSREQKRLKPARAQQLRAAIERERAELVRQVAEGSDGQSYSEEEFARQALARAVRAVHLGNEDFETVTVERSLRLVQLVGGQAQALPTVSVQFRFVERLRGAGTGWVAVGDTVHEEAGEFEARLIMWRLGRAGEVYQAAGLAIAVVGGVAIALEAGLIAALVQLAGGTGAVLTSIAISEVIYLLRVLFGDAKLTLEGFLVAALEGYLNALTFRLGGGLGRLTATRIGTATLRQVVTGWVAQRLVTGVVGGAVAAGLSRFAEDVIAIATGQGSWSSIGEYVRRMALGAVLGAVGEFVLAPALKALLSRAGGALAGAAELVATLRAEGWSGLRLAATLAEGLAGLRAALAELVDTAVAGELTAALRARLGRLLSELGASAVARQVLELNGARLTGPAAEGLGRFLTAADAATPARAFELIRAFARHPAETVQFLEVLTELTDDAVRHLVNGTFGSRAELAAFLGRIGRYPPAGQRAVVGLLAELGIRAEAPEPGMTAQQVLDRQLELFQQLRAAGRSTEAANLNAQIDRLRAQADATEPYNPRRAAALRANAERLAREQLQPIQARAQRDAAVGPAAEVVPTDAELDQRFAELESGTAPPGARPEAWIRLRARGLREDLAAAERLVRPIFRSRSGNRVVFRVEGGTDPESRSRELVDIAPDGTVRLRNRGLALNLNFGVFERAVEFLLENRPGARLKVFEVEEAWFRMLRGVSTPEQGRPAAVDVVDPVTDARTPLHPPGEAPGISEVRRVPRTVDTRYGEDQLQVPPQLVRELQEFIVPGSGRVLEFYGPGDGSVTDR